MRFDGLKKFAAGLSSLRFQNLESRIVGLFLIVIFAVQFASFFTIRIAIEENARVSIREQLVTGKRVFRRLLEQNAQRLMQSANTLALDHLFYQAISTNDRAAMQDMLSNQVNRNGAAFGLLIGPDREIKVATAGNPPDIEKILLPLIDQADQNGSATGLSIIDNKPVQIVVTPVKSASTLAWLSMATVLDKRLTTDMRALSALQVSIFTVDKNGVWQSEASTLSPVELLTLAQQLQKGGADQGFAPAVQMSGHEFMTYVQPLSTDLPVPASMVLQYSVDDAIAPYRHSQFTLLILTAIGIIIAVAGSVYTARRIADPLRQLANAAQRLGVGDYAAPLQIRGGDEIGKLVDAFKAMRRNLATRELDIRRLAYWDRLTNLPNRAQFINQLNDAINAARENNEPCCILLLGLNHFKIINDQHGRRFGDALLLQISERIKFQVASDFDQVARFGSDEFAVLLPLTQVEQARAVATRILVALQNPIALNGQNIEIAARIGIAAFPEHGFDAELLLGRAELAMNAAKTRGADVLIFDASLES